MRKILGRYRALKVDKYFYKGLIMGALFLTIALIVNYSANNYTARSFTGPGLVQDFILDHIPVVNVDDIFFEGAIVLVIFYSAQALAKPARIPFILKSGALFVLVRSFFIVLTHIAPPPHESVLIANNFLERLIGGSGNDLFFSGHTGFPFLMALVFWHHKLLRPTFLIASIIFATAVLLGHLHYSIDVFAAFFITYGIFHMALKLFPTDYQRFLKAES